VALPSNPYAATPTGLDELPVAPKPGDAGYVTALPTGLKPISQFAPWLGETMPPDACGLLHNSDFAHNKTRGVTKNGYQLLGGWEVPDNAHVKGQIVPAQAGRYASALRLTTKPDAAQHQQIHSLRILQVIKAPQAPSDTFVVRVWMRSPDKACVSLSVNQHAQNICSVAIREKVQLTSQWKEYEFRGRRTHDLPYQEVWIGFEMADCPGTIELTGTCLTIEAPSQVFR
jgi:hypothetical protein